MIDNTVSLSYIPECEEVKRAALFLLDIRESYPQHLPEICTLLNILDDVHKSNEREYDEP